MVLEVQETRETQETKEQIWKIQLLLGKYLIPGVVMAEWKRGADHPSIQIGVCGVITKAQKDAFSQEFERLSERSSYPCVLDFYSLVKDPAKPLDLVQMRKHLRNGTFKVKKLRVDKAAHQVVLTVAKPDNSTKQRIAFDELLSYIWPYDVYINGHLIKAHPYSP